MQITPFTVHDLYSSSTFEVELTRDSILEKVSYYLSILSFLLLKKDQFFGCVLLLHVNRIEILGSNKR